MVHGHIIISLDFHMSFVSYQLRLRIVYKWFGYLDS